MVANIIFPAKCIFCGDMLQYDISLHICASCYQKLPFSVDKLLLVAQKAEDTYCDGAISLFQYTGMIKESLIRYKFYNKPHYYRTYARLLTKRIENLLDVKKYSMVLSVPLYKSREIERGYNQAFLISKALGKELELPECSKLIKRVRHTQPQSLLDNKKRSENVSGAFKVTIPEKIKGKSILLVDDILTTGFTLEEAGGTLKRAGAERVTGIVVATGRK